MVKQSKIKYCKETTKSHPLARKYDRCIEKIKNVCKNAGEKSPQFNEEICLNLDKVEENLASFERRTRNRTMDISFGIVKNNEKEMVLCEFKLNCRNPRNLSYNELNGKISNSKNLLGHEVKIHRPYLFIFRAEIKEQARNRIRRLFNNERTVEVLDIPALKDLFF